MKQLPILDPQEPPLTWTQGRVRKKAMMFPQAFGSHLLSTFKPFHPKPHMMIIIMSSGSSLILACGFLKPITGGFQSARFQQQLVYPMYRRWAWSLTYLSHPLKFLSGSLLLNPSFEMLAERELTATVHPVFVLLTNFRQISTWK